MEQSPAADYGHVVVGAGIEGSWTALQLLRLLAPEAARAGGGGVAGGRGRVLLLEQFPLPHSRGSSHGQTRIIRHAYAETFHAQLMPRAYQQWFQLQEDAGEKLFVPTPLLCVADESGYKDLDATLDSLRGVFPGEEGVKFRELTPAALALEFPQASFSDKHRGCLEVGAGILLADRCLAAVQRQFTQLGGEIRDGTVVTSLTPGPRVLLELTSGGQKLRLSADKVAVCAGPWTQRLLEPLLHPLKLPLTPLRVNVYYWRLKEGGRGAIKTSLIDLSDNGEFWGIPECEYPGMVKFLHPVHLPADPDSRDEGTEADDHSEVCAYVARHLPGVEAAPALVEKCMYTMTPDHVSIVDLVPGHPNIAFACGFSGTGFKKAPAIGEMVARLLHPPTHVDMTPFALARFKQNQ